MGLIGFFKRIFGKQDPQPNLKADHEYAPAMDSTSRLSLKALVVSNPWAYRAIHTIANATATVSWRIFVYSEDGGRTEDDRHPASLLLHRPCEWYDYWRLMYLSVWHILLSGQAIWEIQRNDKGMPVALYPLIPDYVTIKHDSRNLISGYQYEPPSGSQYFLPPESVVHIYLPDPQYEGKPLAPAAAIRNTIQIDYHAQLYNQQYFRNSAIPCGVLETDRNMSSDTVQRLRQSWDLMHKGSSRAHRIAILEGGLRFKPISPTHKDMQFKELRVMARDEILSALGVPPVVVGLLEHASYANAYIQKRMFYTDTVIPLLRMFSFAINQQLIQPHWANAEFDYDVSSIEALREERADAVKGITTLLEHDVITINEARRELGYDDVDWGSMPVMTLSEAELEKRNDIDPEHLSEHLNKLAERLERRLQRYIEQMFRRQQSLITDAAEEIIS